VQNPNIAAITNAASGTYSFTVTSAAPANCVSATGTVLVSANPSPSITVAADASPNPTCAGGTTQLSVLAAAPGYSVTPIAFAPISPSGTPSAGPSGDDVITGDVAIGFPFTFYGTTYTNVRISTNGFMTFDATTDNGCCSGDVLPNSVSLTRGPW
jgi:hypothetical protein